MSEYKLQLKGVCKSFPGVKALDNVQLSLRPGTVHALMGENGAGKSTLIKVLTGVHPFESGEIKMEGKDAPIVNRSPQDAQDNGISTVYQEVNLCPNLTVAENLFIGREPRKAGLIDWKTMNKKSTELLKDLQIDAKATDKLEECSLAKQQMIAIARAVDMNCRVLILDEPTNHLDIQSKEILESAMNAYTGTILYVSHDRYFINKTATRILEISDHGLTSYPGNYQDYIAQKEKEKGHLLLLLLLPPFLLIQNPNSIGNSKKKNKPNREKKKIVLKKSKSRSQSWKRNKKNFQKLCLYLKMLLILRN